VEHGKSRVRCTLFVPLENDTIDRKVIHQREKKMTNAHACATLWQRRMKTRLSPPLPLKKKKAITQNPKCIWRFRRNAAEIERRIRR
jgi:hypothetical protein